MKQIKTRNLAMDAIRCFALFNVVATHYFGNIGYFDQNVSGWWMYAMTIAWSLTQCCVPLFLILSGYLLRTRRPTGKYYSKLIKTVSIYILSSLCCLIYRYFILQQPFSPVGAVLDILCFIAAPYSWYIEMYLGLFLIIPFLNILYNNIGTQKEKRLLLLVFIILSAVPGVLNIYKFGSMEWWITPSSSDQYQKIFPSWWINIYPITYYFIGCYLSEYPIKLRARTSLGLFALALFAVGTFNFYRSRGSEFVWGIWEAFSALPILVLAVLVFSLFSNLDYSRFGAGTARFLGKLSDWSLGAFLVSWLFDAGLTPILCEQVPDIRYRFLLMPIMVTVISACSLGLSGVINLIYSGLEKLFVRKNRTK